jgi:hypothetical protein
VREHKNPVYLRQQLFAVVRMNPGLWIVNILCGFGIAYTISFSGATLAFGRALSTTNSKTGYQDAVTPPWAGKFAFLMYGTTIVVIVASWWAFGAYRGSMSIVVFIASVIASRQILPAEDSFHYKSLIIQSMASRYADYVRDNDKVRAAAMKDLLDKTGVPMDYKAPS